MSDHWEQGEFSSQTPTDGYDNGIDIETSVWAFQCSLKKYEDDIEQFFEDVSPHLHESAEHIEYYCDSTLFEPLMEKVMENTGKPSAMAAMLDIRLPPLLNTCWKTKFAQLYPIHVPNQEKVS